MKRQYQSKERGQSLVEVAIIMPIILLLLGGVVEISNLLIAQNRVATSTRAATSFATTNFREDALPDGWADSMAGVALNSVNNTPQGDSELWEFAVVRAKTNETGDGFERWEVGYPNGTAPDNMPSNEELQQKVIADLGGSQSAGSLDLVITVANADYNSLLSLNSIFSVYPDELTAVNVGMVDKEKEPAVICLAQEETGVVTIYNAIDYITGAYVAPPGSQGDGYWTKRTWNGGESQERYSTENSGNRIKFENTDLGEDGRVETDRFKLLVEGSPSLVGIVTKAASTGENGDGTATTMLDLTIGNSKTDSSGFTTRVASATPDGNGNTIVTLEVTSDNLNGTPALSHIIFKFVGTECTEWGVPEDTGDYTGILGS